MSNLAGRLLAGQRVEKQGAFTVDVDKAKTKLERFRLANPIFFTIELVQAAVLSGATRVDITVDADDFILTFEATRPLGPDDLADLESAVLVRGPQAHPARLQLALATSAAQALRPKRLTFVGNGATLAIIGDQTTVTPSAATTTMRFSMRESFRVGHVGEFFSGLIGKTPEEVLLRERCRYAGIDVVVNGRKVSGSPWPGSPSIDLVGKGERGAVGFLPDPHAASQLYLLRAGVLQEQLPWAEATKRPVPTGVFGVVDGEHLPRDASFTKFVRGKEFRALVDGLERPLLHLGPLLEADILGEDALAIERAGALARWLGPRVLQKEHAIVAQAPLLRDPLGRALSLRALREQKTRRGTVLVRRSRDRLDPDLLEDDVVVQLRGDADEALLTAVELPTADGDALIGGRQERRGRYHDFKNRVAPSAIDEPCLRRIIVRREELGIELGLRRGGPTDAVVHVVVDGNLLVTLRKPLPVPRLTILLTGPFSPTPRFDDVVRDAAFAGALAHAIAALPTLLDGPFSHTERDDAGLRDALLPLLGTALDGDVLWRAAAEAFGIPGPRRRDLPTLALAGPTAHGVVEHPLIPVFPRGTTSMASLRQGREPLGVVPPDAPPFRPSTQEAVVAGDVLLAVLKRALPQRQFVSLADEADQERRRLQVLQRPIVSRHIDGVVAQVPVDDVVDEGSRRQERLRRVGFVGFVPGDHGQGTRLRVFYRGRLLQDRVLPGPIPGLVAAIDDEAAHFTTELRSRDIAPLAARALAAVPDLVARMAATRIPSAWVLARRIVTLAFPGDAATTCWQKLARSAGRHASEAWRAILEHAERIDPRRLDDAFVRLGALPTAPSAQGLLTLAPATRAATGHVAFLDAALVHPQGLVSGLLAAFRLGDLELSLLVGGVVTLEKLLQREQVRVTSRGGVAVPGFDDVIIADADAALVLRRLGLAVEDVDEPLQRARARHAFEARATRTTTLPHDVEAIIQMEVNDAHGRGIVALLADPTRTIPRGSVDVLYEGRALTRLELGEQIGVACFAILDTTAVSPNADFTGIVNDKRRDALITRVRDAVVDLCLSLAGTAPDARHPAARSRLLEYLARDRKRTSEVRAAEKIRQASLFVDVSGSPVDLAAPTKKNPLPVLTRPLPGRPATLAHAVIVDDANDRALLEQVVPTVIVDRQWQTELEAQERRGRLPPLPDIEDQPVLHRRVVRLGQTRLTLVIPDPLPARALIHVGDDGLLVDRLLLKPGCLPCDGVIEGESVVENWQRARLSDKLKQAIRRETATLWHGAMTSWRSGKGLDDDERETLRRALLVALTRLLQVNAGDLIAEELALRSALRSLPLLPLATGGMLSADDAVHARPEEHLRFLVEAGLLDKKSLHQAKPTPPPAPPRRDPPPETRPGDAPAPAPSAPPAPPPPPTPAERLQERLVAELRVVRRSAPLLLSDTELQRLRVVGGPGRALVTHEGGAVVVDATHPVAAAAIEAQAADGVGPDPAVALMMVASAAVAALNAVLETITDDEERALLVALARHARTIDARRRSDDNAADVIR
jgi:hypothetical protein